MSLKPQPQNVKLITKMVELGNLGQNIRIVGETKQQRLKKFREIYYGSNFLFDSNGRQAWRRYNHVELIDIHTKS